MSTDPVETATERPEVAKGAGASDAQAQPSEQELRAAYEAELSRVSSSDMILQATVSLLNIGGHRVGLARNHGQSGAGPGDLEQVRDAIDGVRALLPILERGARPDELRPLREALSQLQMAYAREAGTSSPQDQAGDAAAPTPKPETPTAPPKQDAPAAADRPDGTGPAVSSGRLWVPGR